MQLNYTPVLQNNADRLTIKKYYACSLLASSLQTTPNWQTELTYSIQLGVDVLLGISVLLFYRNDKTVYTCRLGIIAGAIITTAKCLEPGSCPLLK